MSGRMKGGERVIVERVADDLGVSATPVREAIARLLQEGIIEDMSSGRLHVVELTNSYVVDTYFVRGALEGLGAELATTRISDSALTKLEARILDATKALADGDYVAYSDADRRIHQQISDAACNPMLTRQLESIRSHIGYIRDYSYRHVGVQLAQSHDEHTPILEAMRQRDPSMARRAMESHIRNSGNRIAAIASSEQAASADPESS